MSLPLLLDCTLRDGGYYNAWDFDKRIVDAYIQATNRLPIDCIELGYRNNPQKEYLGKYGYCPVFELADIRSKSIKKLAVMLNEKSVIPADLVKLLDPIRGMIDMVRIAVDPQYFDRALILAENIKKRGFVLGFNVMYMSKWKEYTGFLDNLSSCNDIVDVFCMVDSFGSVSPGDVQDTIQMVKEKVRCPIGFHGHNNLELGLSNTLTAIACGVDYVDATILGMGRGAGNVKVELLLTYMNKYGNLDIDFNVLGEVISMFSPLLQKYQWGTNLPYMLSGVYSLPQKDIMEWTNNRLYAFNTIVRALNNQKANIKDNAKYPIVPVNDFDALIIIGGGINAVSHVDGMKAFIQKYRSIALIHATARNAAAYQFLDIPQYFCLAGSEGKRLSRVFAKIPFKGIGVLPPYPRKMGTDVPDFVRDVTYELSEIEFTKTYFDSCTVVALQLAALYCKKAIFIVGYDGYPGNILSEKEMTLTKENRLFFSDFISFYNRPLISLTPSLYKELYIQSLYQDI
jgi:4-hydroxy 2-oxovalerate aldolase